MTTRPRKNSDKLGLPLVRETCPISIYILQFVELCRRDYGSPYQRGILSFRMLDYLRWMSPSNHLTSTGGPGSIRFQGVRFRTKCHLEAHEDAHPLSPYG
jgi:hypothetical protein